MMSLFVVRCSLFVVVLASGLSVSDWNLVDLIFGFGGPVVTKP